MKEYVGYVLKGLGVGIANIIPGVSGGTIALITGIFESELNSGNINLKLVLETLFDEIASFTEQSNLILI